MDDDAIIAAMRQWSPASGALSDWSRQRSGYPRHLAKRPLADHGVTSACGTGISGLKSSQPDHLGVEP